MAKILIISTMEGFPWGGSESLWLETAKKLSAHHQVACSVHWWPEIHPRIRSLEKNGIKIFPRRCAENKFIRAMNWFLPQALKRKPVEPVEQIIQSYRPDFVLISQGGNTDGQLPMQVCKKWNVPYANVIQAVPEAVFWPDDREIELQRPLYHGSKRLFFISERNHEFLETQFAARFANYSVIRNPFNVDYDISIPWPASPEPLRLACVARLELYAKGQDLLVDILSLPKWRERNISVDLFGAGPNEWILQEQIRRLGLNNLKLRGFVENVSSIWADHHALILPSRQEGLPLALVEAFLSRRPAIVTRVGGNAELVEDGVNGFVAPAPTAEFIDQALERLWENRARLMQMGLNARQTAEQKIPPDPVDVFAKEISALISQN